MVEVGRLAAVGGLDAGEALRGSFTGGPVNDSQVGDGRLWPAGLGFRQVLLQGRGLVSQARHHKVVGHTVTLVLDHGWAYLRIENQKINWVGKLTKQCFVFLMK